MTIDANGAVLNMLADLIHERLGQTYPSNRFDLLSDRLSPLVVERGLPSLLDYYYLLRYDEDSDEEWKRVASALAVNETYFWREYDQIQATVEQVVPAIQQDRPGLPVRIWHAACASGEEPYTMAISLLEAGAYQRGPIEILATDVNADAIAQARAGAYKQRSFRSIPPYVLDKYFERMDGQRYRLANDVRARVRFQRMNLMDGQAIRLMPPFDVIFCRNVFIYFSDRSIGQVVNVLSDVLQPDGYLFVAAAESLLRITTTFDLTEVSGAFAYRKNGVTA